jgi:phospholipid/cholesterol/gamma-HCH transport system ATP-binding protein
MAMLYHGKIIADGTPEEFRNHSDPVVSQFIHGNPEGPLTQDE